MKFRFTLSHEVDTDLGAFEQAGLGTSWVGLNVSWVGSSESKRLYRLFAAQSIEYTINYAWSATVSGGSYSAQIGYALNGVMVNFETVTITGNQSGSVILTPSGPADSIAIRLTGSGSSIDLTMSSLTLDEISDSQIIDEPNGWEDAVLKLERHEEFHSLVEHFEGSFTFYGTDNDVNGGIDFIREKERDFGPDATIKILIEIAPDDVNFETVFEGQLDMASKEEFWDNTMEVGIIREDFWSKFINRLDTPVNIQSELNLDGKSVRVMPPININLTPQVINQSMYLTEVQGQLNNSLEEYHQYQPDSTVLDELDDWFLEIPNASNSQVPVPYFDATYAGDLVPDIRIEFSLWNVDGIAESDLGWINPVVHGIKVFIQFNEDTPEEMTYEAKTYTDASVYASWGGFDTPADNSIDTTVASYSTTRTMAAHDTVRIYLQNDGSVLLPQYAFWGSLGLNRNLAGDLTILRADLPAGMTSEPTFYRFTQKTISPATNAEGFLIHDIGAAICERIIGVENCFYSKILGSPLVKYQPGQP
jgi:hypothetical protein